VEGVERGSIVRYNVEKTKQRIIRESDLMPRFAEMVAKNLRNYLQPNLLQLLDRWSETGERFEYKHRGITLSEIMKRERYPYYDALGHMQVLIDNPKSADLYIKGREYY